MYIHDLLIFKVIFNYNLRVVCFLTDTNGLNSVDVTGTATMSMNVVLSDGLKVLHST